MKRYFDLNRVRFYCGNTKTNDQCN